jgi:hypothetical protein
LVLVVGAALLLAVGTGSASGAQASPGALQICEAGDSAPDGQTFSFTAAKGSSSVRVTVPAGSCASPLSAVPGNWQITQDSNPPWEQSGASVFPLSAFVSENDGAGRVRASVSSGAATQVTVVNRLADATIELCPWSSSPGLQNDDFTYDVSGRSVTAPAGWSRDAAGCTAPVSADAGTKVKLTATVPDGVSVVDVTASANATLNNSNNGVVRVTVGKGLNQVWFENEPFKQVQTGYIEVCEDAGDQFVSGSTGFQFTVTDHAGVTAQATLTTGQCSGPLQLAAGNAVVAQAPDAASYVSAISTLPDPNAVVTRSLGAGIATIAVPVSAIPAGEVQVHVVNSTPLATIQVCSALAPGGDAIAGTKLSYTVADAANTPAFGIVAATGAGGVCKTLDPVPVGSTVSVTQAGTPFVALDGGAPGVAETQTITAAAGSNTITFASAAFGSLGVCAVTADNSPSTAVASFTVGGFAAPVTVPLGTCADTVLVPAGAVAVAGSASGYSLAATAATGPTGDNRLVGGTNPVTVTVPFAGTTFVAFTATAQPAA